MTGARVLIIDDEPAMLENCERMLGRLHYATHLLSNPAPLREAMREFKPDVLLLDLRLPGVDGFGVLAAALAEDPVLPVIIMTAYASVSSAVRAVQEGAFDYLGKPFTADQLDVAVRRATAYRQLAQENQRLRTEAAGSHTAELVGSSPAMRRLAEQIAKIAPAEASVLITGESGTGKELVARSIHQGSPRGKGPFVPIDCAALPEALLEGELFGYERGAFTGAVNRKTGLLVSARGGTVFLDEVTEFSPVLQSKLLRALEERTVRPVGSNTLVPIDVRVLAATNRDVEAAVAAGTFRSDLYYRLNVIRVELPALRDRTGDVPILFTYYLERFATASEQRIPQITPDAWDALLAYRWPGNVRELRNLAHRLVVLHGGGRVSLADLPAALRGWVPGTDDAGGTAQGGSTLPYLAARDQALERFQADYVRRLLAAHDGNVTRAALAAGVSRRTVHRWLAETGMAHPAGERP